MAPDKPVFDVVAVILDENPLDRSHVTQEQGRPSGKVQRYKVAILLGDRGEEAEVVFAEGEQVPKKWQPARSRRSMVTISVEDPPGGSIRSREGHVQLP